MVFLPYYQHLITEKDGQIPIGIIVNQELNVNVLGYNYETDQIDYVPIINHLRVGKSDDWIRIEHNGNSKSKRIITSPDKKIHTPDGFTRASKLEKGDEITSRFSIPTEEQEELLCGSMLGDGSLTDGNPKDDTPTKNPLFRETHSIKQEDYLYWKCRVLGRLSNEPYTEFSKYGEDYSETEKICFYTEAIPYLNKMRDFIPNTEFGRKVPDWFKLTPKSLAVWYCDDGSLPMTTSQRRRAIFATHCFSTEDCRQLVKELNRFGIKSKINEYGKGNVIELSADSTEVLFQVISEYIPPSMNYKVLDDYSNDTCDWKYNNPSLDSFEITDIKLNAETRSPMEFLSVLPKNWGVFSSQVLVHSE